MLWLIKDKNMKKHVTIKDIAHELGISKSTVSRAFNDRYDVKPETRKAVLEMAEKLHFRPNPHAANLVSHKTNIIGVVVPEFVNTFFPRIIIAIQNYLESEGYNVLITQSAEDPEVELRNLQMLEANRVEGILLSVCQDEVNAEHYRRLIEEGTPVVFFSRDCPSVNASRVCIDDYHLAFFATERLIDNGTGNKITDILHLMGPEDLSSSRDRYMGWLDAVKKNGCSTDKKWQLKCDGFDRATGYRMLRKWLGEHPGECPQGIFAFNDPLAIGSIKALKEMGYDVPGDVRVMGFSETQTALIVEPQLSSVAQPLEEIGNTAAKLLIEKIKNPKAPDRKVLLRAKINVRKSSDPKAPDSAEI